MRGVEKIHLPTWESNASHPKRAQNAHGEMRIGHFPMQQGWPELERKPHSKHHEYPTRFNGRATSGEQCPNHTCPPKTAVA